MPNPKLLSEDRIRELETYLHVSRNIVRETYRQSDPKDVRLVWSGHKDSTLTLWIWCETCKQYSFEMPKAVTLDEGDPFEEVEEFLHKMSKEWKIQLDVACNKEVLEVCNHKLNAEIDISKLSDRNQKEIERIGFPGLEKFPFEPESFIGNHLMKSVALNVYLEENNVKVIVQGLRWDEQAVRADDLYFEEVEAEDLQPAQMRIRPILHICERSLWNIYHHWNLPFVSLYKEGYRSLGVKSTTKKTAEIPAWEQDLENTVERAGRRQDKEKAMRRLRQLGYM